MQEEPLAFIVCTEQTREEQPELRVRSSQVRNSILTSSLRELKYGKAKDYYLKSGYIMFITLLSRESEETRDILLG